MLKENENVRGAEGKRTYKQGEKKKKERKKQGERRGKTNTQQRLTRRHKA